MSTQDITISEPAVISANAIAPHLLHSIQVVAPVSTAFVITSSLTTTQAVFLSSSCAPAIAFAPDVVAQESTLSLSTFFFSPANSQVITIGLEAVVSASSFGDAVNRGEPFEPWAVMGDLVNRGEPFSSNYKIETKYLGVASATAPDPTIEIGAPPVGIVRLPRIGQSGTKRAEREREREESIVWAKLIRVNDKSPEEKIEGFTRVYKGVATNFRVIAEGSPTTRVRKAGEDIKIAVARVK